MRSYFLLLLFVFSNNTFSNNTTCNELSLFEKKSYSEDNSSVDISAEYSEVKDKNIFSLSGNVELAAIDYAISADKLIINKISNTSKATGNVLYQTDTLQIVSDSMDLERKNNTNHYEFSSPMFSIDSFNGNASTLKGTKNYKSFANAKISTCESINPEWHISAKELILDSEKNQGSAENVTLNFFDIPILYSPYMDWVITGKGSGFLFPTLNRYKDSNQKTQFQTKIPYFLNIASDRDLLMTLNNLSDRGNSYELHYRQLLKDSNYLEDGRLEIGFNSLENDKITSSKRWLLKNKFNGKFSDDSLIEITNNKVSDKNYFREVLHEDTSTERLYSTFKYSTKYNGTNIALYSESEQVVNDGSDAYTRNREIRLNKNEYIFNSPLQFNLISTNFSHKNINKTTGDRNNLVVKYAIKKPTNAIDYGLNLSYLHTNYELDDGNSFDRQSYDLNLNSRIKLEREFISAGNEFIQTLEPRISYSYSPIRDQRNLPNFDSGVISQTYSNLFSGRQYTGSDRISNNNFIALGLESEILDFDTGQELLSMYVGQKYNFADTTTNIGGSQVSLREYSNIFSGISYLLGRTKFSFDIDFDPETSNINKKSSTIGYYESPQNFINLSYIDDNDENIKIASAFKISDALEIGYSLTRSITDQINNTQTLGISYESCCWGTRFVYGKDHINGSNYIESLGLEFVFKGLGSTSPNLRRKLLKDIPNYAPSLYE